MTRQHASTSCAIAAKGNGIEPADKEVLLRRLDFWQLENGLIREDRVLAG